MGVSLVAFTLVRVFVMRMPRKKKGAQEARVQKKQNEKRNTGGKALPKSDHFHHELIKGLALSHQPTLYLEPKWLR